MADVWHGDGPGLINAQPVEKLALAAVEGVTYNGMRFRTQVIQIRSTVRKTLVTIYSRPGCHLCDEAKAIILAAGRDEFFDLEEINIEDNEELQERYRYEIPVVLIDGTKAFKYKVDAAEFRKKLRRLGHAKE